MHGAPHALLISTAKKGCFAVISTRGVNLFGCSLFQPYLPPEIDLNATGGADKQVRRRVSA
jgi:hypothetical protein